MPGEVSGYKIGKRLMNGSSKRSIIPVARTKTEKKSE